MATIDFAWAQIGEPGSAPGVTVDFAWAQLEDTPVVATPPAPSAVSGVATGATTANITVTDASGGTAAHRVQVRPVGGTWADAVGATNPMPAGTLLFQATSLAAAVEHETQVRAERTGLNSSYVAGAASWWQDLPVGGGGELPTDTTSPTLTGTIAITALTSTSYTFTCPAGSDAVGVTVYQWRLGGSGAWTSIAGGGRTDSVSGRTPAATDTLEMRCLDAAGNISPVLSRGVTLLGIAPQVTAQPGAQSVVEGASFTFTAAFSGTPTPTRQWFRNGAPISGATGLSYTATATLADSGAVYTCTATNSAGLITTNAATLTVTAGSVAPSFVTQPASQTVVAGQPVTFSVVVAGTTPINLQWRRNGVAISGANAASYGFTAQQGDNGATFDVVAANVVNSATSSPAALTVTVIEAFVPYEVFISDALAFAAHAPDPLIVKYAREAAIEFFQRTAAWKQRLPSIQSIANQTQFTLVLPNGQCVIARMLGYWINGREASLVDVHTGALLSGDGDAMDAAWTNERATVHINPPPPAGLTLQFDVALKPSRGSLGLLQPLWEQYADALLSGLLARLLAVQNREWSNPQLAGVYAAKFKADIDSVTIQAAKAFGKTRPRKNAVWF